MISPLLATEMTEHLHFSGMIRMIMNSDDSVPWQVKLWSNITYMGLKCKLTGKEITLE